ncbi:MAG: chromosome segregation protein SMC [Phycisphaerae bacterium]
MKLSKLVLAGFKSFADQTEFDFDAGISCVVGPNGCGKSNIVDAIKWVLGEQSAKSLRGSEMMDVIFNGSSSRKACGCAEVTLVFDNSTGVLKNHLEGGQPLGESVSVGRRLFRSGQSDYLINGTPCRLKDIRELFMDTGVGHDAYALIEQGRVESFLQASHEDRRAIFDEAAGISKYKARKKEALRKLERVEQNLLRLDDVLGELEKRLRSVKYQAGKANSFQAYTQQLKELKSLHFLAQYCGMVQQRSELQTRLNESSDALALVGRRIEQLDAAGSGTEFELADLDRSLADLQGRIASMAAQVESNRQRAAMMADKARELQDEIAAGASRVETLEAKAESCRQGQQDCAVQLQDAQGQCDRLARDVETSQEAFQQGQSSVAALTAQLEDEKSGTIDLLRRTAQLHNEINASTIRRENLSSRRTSLADRAQRVTRELEDLIAQRAAAQVKLDQVQAVLQDAQTRLEETRRSAGELSTGEAALAAELSAVREQRSSAAGRIQALQEMLDRLDGVDSGAKRVLEAHGSGRLPAIRGIVGQFVRTDVQHARVIEAALAGADQQLVVDRFSDIEAVHGQLAELVGDSASVELLALDRLGPWYSDLPAQPCPQVVARAIDLVQFDAWLAPAMWRILGRTLVTATLADAAAAAAMLPSGLRFVTLAGEVLEADGLVRIGATRGGGMISRSSELSELQTQVQTLGQKIEALEADWRATRDQKDHVEGLIHSLRTAIYEANTERVESQGRLAGVSESISQLQSEQPVLDGDLASLAEEIELAMETQLQAQQQAQQLEELNAHRQQQVEALQEQIAAASKAQEELGQSLTDAKVQLAHTQQKKLTIAETANALVRQGQQIAQDLAAAAAQIGENRGRLAQAQEAAAAAAAAAVQIEADKAALAGEMAHVEESRTGLQAKLKEIRQQIAAQRVEQESAGEKLNALRVEMGQLDAHVTDLVSRAADDMGMNLVELSRTYEHDENRDWSAVEGQINDLKGKIERLGNVNLDAISEQDELEKRREFLAAELADVRDSQRQIEELIERLNTESHDLFVETFEIVRRNFQELFRKLFGGGRADILLTMPEDILESGIEIVARPPGKETRSLSLLSGGEKTMTALALMFSMFRHRPCPFCLLDEVDAALDEANTERFSMLVREFIDSSQFIIISHAKRTMSMASVLYGVTMQEPGVSRRISVKFEDVGHKLDAQLEPVEA